MMDLTNRMSTIGDLKANFYGHEKEGHFHYKNFLRALARGSIYMSIANCDLKSSQKVFIMKVAFFLVSTKVGF